MAHHLFFSPLLYLRVGTDSFSDLSLDGGGSVTVDSLKTGQLLSYHAGMQVGICTTLRMVKRYKHLVHMYNN